jgi:hypothetical protein
VSPVQKLVALHLRGTLFFPLLLAALLFFFLQLARADSLEDAARALARKVAASHRKNLGSTYAWENHSIVSSVASERMREAFEVELEKSRGRLQHESHADLTVLVTDGPAQIDLLAEDSSQENDVFASVSFSKSQFAGAERTVSSLEMSRELLWQQPEAMLDLAIANDPSGKPDVLLILGKEKLSLYRWNEDKWVPKDSVPLPPHKAFRDLRGEIHFDDHFFQFHLPGIECDGDAFQRLAFECEEDSGLWSPPIYTKIPLSLDAGQNSFAVNPHYIGTEKFPLARFFSAAQLDSERDEENGMVLSGTDGHTYFLTNAGQWEKGGESLERLPVDWGSDLVSVKGDCRGHALLLATSAKDQSSPDSLQGYAVGRKAAVPVTAIMEFPGPIVSLGERDKEEAIAIIHNLTTGNYEAYRVAVDCHE